MAKARSVQSMHKDKLIFVTMNAEEIGWKKGDSVRYEKVDENTVILKRLT